MTYLFILLCFVFFAGVAMTINEGLWNNTILLFCILLSCLIATVTGVPLGVLLFEQAGLKEPSAWYCIFVGLWGVFTITLVLLRIVVEKISKTRVRFFTPFDKIGGIAMSLTVAVMFTSFAAFTLWNVPIKAGEWKKSEASASMLKNFAYAVTPYNTVYKRFVQAEGIDSSFFEK